MQVPALGRYLLLLKSLWTPKSKCTKTKTLLYTFLDTSCLLHGIKTESHDIKDTKKPC